MVQGVVEISRRELQFTYELEKKSSCCFHLVNKSDYYVAFKVKTTSPKRYCVRPNTGVIGPKATCDFTVTMQAQSTPLPDMQLKDKFLVQTTVVLPGTSDEDLVPSFFSKETNAYIDEIKLRVILVDASRLPVEQQINSVPNTDAAVEVPVSRDTLNVENEVPVIEREAPAPQEQTSAVVTVTEDVQNLKSKLNNFESKLEGAEKMIIKLKEENRSMTQKEDKLQQEMVFLRKVLNCKPDNEFQSALLL